MICWIGPNAHFRSTKNVIAKQRRVQIISPGMGSISDEPLSSVEASAASGSRLASI